MKLRIKGNSIRLRLSRPDVARLARDGRVEETTAFGVRREDALAYAVESSPTITDVAARLASGRITVVLPEALAREWASTDRVGIAAEQRGVGPDGAGVLQILIEKDFACLDRRDEDADAFANPAATRAC
ncbi:DUF7009 family protein [Roseisolibacter agri]|uniref:Uncharacterized protein n=1 Tax=Roseisolibacter agri TaxID=2014610 RepID=A0AA37V054_9BACT|nr:hypothetical protein [Roseisolibacter agri]GLC23785.1 hypothetical protein rosag_02980 [Roseisolibacter agri]